MYSFKNIGNIKKMGKSELTELITHNLFETSPEMIKSADNLRNEYYGKKVFFRGLIEFTNYCKNDCFYCGIRHSNNKANRYRLSAEQIISCCEEGYNLGFRSFVMQGGEDNGFCDSSLNRIIYGIKEKFPDCALTLSCGEKSKEVYKEYFNSGVDRYLLRHETADDIHYSKLHPKALTLKARKQCLYDLKEIGFQIGAGFMVGSPFQTVCNLADDLLFLKELEPHMVGIGPFIPHRDTPFGTVPYKNDNEINILCQKHFNKITSQDENTTRPQHPLLNITVTMVALTRHILPKSLLPSTTALATISENGRELAVKAGANVVMPNLTPYDLRESYSLYNNKAHSGCEAAEGVVLVSNSMKAIGYEPCFERGDHIDRK